MPTDLKCYVKFLFPLFLALTSLNTHAQEVNFALQEKFTLEKRDSVIKPTKKYVQIHKQSVSFLDTQIIINRIVKNDSLHHFFSIIYKSNIEQFIGRARESQMITGYKTLNKNDREFNILKTKNNQVLVLYSEPTHHTKICINTLAKSQQTADFLYRNIDGWLSRINR